MMCVGALKVVSLNSCVWCVMEGLRRLYMVEMMIFLRSVVVCSDDRNIFFIQGGTIVIKMIEI